MIGMLWYDNDPKVTLVTKIQRALDYYRGKYGEQPTRVALSPADAAAGTPEIAGVKIVANRMVARNHMLIGKEIPNV
jgi:hypothetical protein